VARVDEIALDVDAAVGEVLLPLAPGRLERPLRLVRRLDELHPLAAASRRRLHDQRVADLVAQAQHLVDGLHRVGRPRDDRDARGLHRRACRRLRAHQLDRGAGRADPGQPRVLDGAREGRVLGEEPVPGMDRLRAGAGRGLQDPLHEEVALGGRPRTDQVGLVRDPDVQRVAVGLRVDRDRSDPELAERPEDPDGDLAAVRDEDFGEGRHRGAYCP
jgi:hypothetical protein